MTAIVTNARNAIGYLRARPRLLQSLQLALVIAVSESFGGWGVQARVAFGEAPEGAPPNIGFG